MFRRFCLATSFENISRSICFESIVSSRSLQYFGILFKIHSHAEEWWFSVSWSFSPVWRLTLIVISRRGCWIASQGLHYIKYFLICNFLCTRTTFSCCLLGRWNNTMLLTQRIHYKTVKVAPILFQLMIQNMEGRFETIKKFQWDDSCHTVHKKNYKSGQILHPP